MFAVIWMTSKIAVSFIDLSMLIWHIITIKFRMIFEEEIYFLFLFPPSLFFDLS